MNGGRVGAPPRLGVLVGEKGNWGFFDHIYEALARDFEMVVHRPREFDLPLLSGRLNRWAFTHQIRTVLRQSDIAFFEWASELLVPASRMDRHCPIVTRLHSYELLHWAPEIAWEGVDRVILVSEAMRAKFSAIYPEHAHKSVVVYNARPLDRFHPAERDFEFDIGMLCALKGRKRVYEMILTIHELVEQGHRPHLHVAGGRLYGYDHNLYFAALHRLVEKLGLEAHVTFYGQVSETAKWLRGLDIFVSNSYWEGHQVALVEAMASGLFCLSHFWDGAEEVLPASNLFAGDRELERKLLEYAALPAVEKAGRRAAMRELAVTRYDPARQIEQIRRVLEETLDGAATAPLHPVATT